MEYSRHILQVFVGQLSSQYEALSIEVSKQTTCLEIVTCIVERLGLTSPNNFELAEVIGNAGGQECKERRLGPNETPVALQMLWPQTYINENPEDFEQHEYRFCLREKSSSDSFWAEPSQLDSQLIRDYFYKFLYQPKDKEYPDLCQLTDLNELSLLENLRARFQRGHIYTYVGSILISVNPFKYYPIYNPKYVKLYQNHRLGELPPHIFAIADSAYHSMLKQRKNQCIVISGESGSGKTEATLFLLHHLTMLSQKGSHGSGVEQTILSSGPVLEAFGNAKTSHNNNSSRFGKFIQVTYKENGLVQGACVQKYLLEKSRICSQAYNERSYHVFYYLLAGASPQERQSLHLLKPSDYNYLSQSLCYSIDGCDEQFEFVRLKQSMEMVGFTSDKQHRLFAVLSAVLLIGNIEFSPKKSTYHHDESVVVRNWETARIIASLLGVSEETLVNAITSKKAKVQGETLVINYRLPEALAARDALAKCLYGALFDWIVLQINYSLISLKEQSIEQNGNSIGVLDIFGFEDFGNHNRFEQFCINYANEHLQHYFNQHVFEYEQEEYRREGISWTNIGFKDNVDCLALIEGKPNGLLCILDDQCSFPGATNETFLQKINNVHKNNAYYEIPQKRELAFIIKHYAGKVKYQVEDIREKNLDLMRPELISVLKNSQFSVVRELAGADPVAVFRWAILRAFFRAVSAFQLSLSKSRKKGSLGHKRIKQKVSVDNTRILAAIENTQNRLRKTRHNRSRSRSHGSRNHKNLKSVKALAQRTQTLTSQGRFLGSRKHPHTVTGRFQMSLQALMEALNQANPYFIRCIKSNAAKEPNMFDNELVQRQLRYTGMLETVRIRQAGFSVRMMFDEFIQHYRILLPHGLLSSQSDVKDFLFLMNLEKSEYQVGKSKVFMRESQKQKLDTLLHQTILAKIILIQRWYKTKYQRKHFLTFRAAAIKIQAQVRCWLAQQLASKLRMEHQAALCIQRMWRGYKARTWYKRMRNIIIRLQSRIRGKLTRDHYLRTLRERENSNKIALPLLSTEGQISQKPTSVKCDDNLLQHRDSSQILASKRKASLPQEKKDLVDYGRRDSLQELSTTKKVSGSDQQQKYSLPEPRRMSETALFQGKRHHEMQEKSEMYHYSPSSGQKPEADGSKVHKAKSFRHRQYQKIPAKRDGSVSESDDNSIESGLHTPPFSTKELTARDISKESFKPVTLKRSITIDDKEKKIYFEEKSSKTLDSMSPKSHTVENLPDEVSSKSNDLKRLLAISSHNLKQSQLRKGEICSSCEKPFTKFFVNHGFKCTSCKRLFHSGCVRKSLDTTCTSLNKIGISVTVEGKENTSPSLKKQNRQEEGNWNLTRTSQFIDRSDEVIRDANELKALEEFITRKIYSLEKAEDHLDTTNPNLHSDLESNSLNLRERKDSQVDQLFCRSLKGFKCYLVSAYSVASQNKDTNVQVVLKYKDLIKNFEKEMNALVCNEAGRDTTFPVTMGVNAFRGFLDEFIRDKSRRSDDKLTKKRKRQRRKKKEKKVEQITYGTHNFLQIFVNIYTQCEVCNSILWLSTKALSCQKCKVTCHQKCLNKVEPSCNQNSSTKAVVVSLDSSNKGHQKGANIDALKIGKVFGVPLENLVKVDEKIPAVIEKIISYVELQGIFTEGLYRKSGASSKVREMKTQIDNDPDSVTFEDTPIHVVTAVFKSYLRELPEPLLTYDAYDPLLRASDLEDPNEMFQCTLNVVHQLPKPNFDLLERLVFHLAHVAQYENYNRMSCNSLAIVFSPCILRSPRSVPVQDSLEDISKQTQVIEHLISRQLSKVYNVLKDIEAIDQETLSTGVKLNYMKSVKMRGVHNPSESGSISENLETNTQAGSIHKLDPREALAVYKLEEQLHDFEERKCLLTFGLTELVRGSSEEELLSTDMSHTGSLEDVASFSTTGPSIRSIISTPSLSLDEGDCAEGGSRRYKRFSSKSTSDNDEKYDSAIQQEYSEDAVMV